MDERLRLLQRRAAAGDPEADEDLLRYRLAIRDLSTRQLRLAAVLGHEPSQWIYEQTPRVKVDHGIQKWMRGLHNYGGAQAVARANLVAAKLVLPRWEQAFPGDMAPQGVIAAAWECIQDPTELNSRSVRRMANHAQAYLRTLSPAWRSGIYPASARQTASDVEGARRAMALQAGQASTLAGLEAAALFGGRAVGPFGSAVEIAGELDGERRVRRAICRALIRWALRPASGS